MANPCLRLLGGFEAIASDGAAIPLATRKSQALAAVLGLDQSGTVPRDRLLGLLWGDRGEEQARHSLSQALTGLRRAFGAAAVRADRDMVALDPALIDVDVRLFLAEAGHGGAGALDRALTWLRGPLLQDFALHEPGWEDWLAVERARFARQATAALLRLGTAAAEQANDAAARAAFEKALVIDPQAEDLHLALMRLHLHHGRAAAALRQYADAAEILRRDLDAVPGPELEAARREARLRGTGDGAQPASAADMRGERKHATALVLTVWAATDPHEDPEDLQSRMDAALTSASKLIGAAGGLVVRSMPDGLQAVFGMPTALEDHAIRACRTALAVSDALCDGQQGSLGVRIALDAGELVLRPGLDGALTIFGAALQRAGRIAAMPQAPVVAATDVVRELAAGRLAFAGQGEALLGAAEQPIPLFRPSEATGAAPSRRATGFVGREAEVAALTASCVAAASGHGEIVAVVGEPGVGKSRLVREFIESAMPTGWRAIMAGTDPQYAEAPYYPIRRLLFGFFGLPSTALPGTIRTRVETTLARFGPSGALSAPILALMDCDPHDPSWARLEPGSRRRRMIEECIRLLHRQSQETPLLVVIEDLHWMDSASRALLEDLIVSLAGARITLVVNFRPEFTHDWSGRGHFRLLRINPLGGGNATALLNELLGSDPSLGTLKEDLAARTGGNPFFLEECVRSLTASGVLAGNSGNFRLGGAETGPVLPETVHAVISARVDRLSALDKQVLQVASVIGADVPCALLTAVLAIGEVAFEGALRRLQTEEFLLPVRLLPDRLVRFKHALTHDVVYASLLRQYRRDLHGQVLAALETGGFAGQADALEMLAHHALRAENWTKASRYAQEAGTRSAAQNASRAAVGHFTQALQALSHLPPTPEQRTTEIDLHLAIRDALFVVGDHDRIPAHLAAAAQIARDVADTPRLCRIKLIQSGWEWTRGQHARALITAQEAMALAETDGNSLLISLAHYRSAVNLGALGRYRESVSALRAAIDRLADAGLNNTIAFGGFPAVFCRSFLCWALSELGESNAAFAVGREGWDMAWERPNNYSRSVMSLGFGHALIRQGRLDEAREVLESGLALYGNSELPATYPLIAAPLGYVLVVCGDIDTGLLHVRRANQQALRRMAPHYVHIEVWLAEALRVSGDVKAALAVARSALETARRQGEAGHEAWALRCLGDLLASSDTTAARDAYQAAAEKAAACEMMPLRAQSLAALRHLDEKGSGETSGNA